MMIQRRAEADQGPCMLMKILSVEGLIRGHQRDKVDEIAEMTCIAKKHFVMSSQISASLKCMFTGFQKCSSRSIKAKQ
jgi:hypothetical protein